MAASWIEVGEEGVSETEAMDSFAAMNERRKRTEAQAQELMNITRKDRGFFSTRTEARNRQASRPSLMSDDGDGTPKNLRARVHQENRCIRCKKEGHWKAQCTEEQPRKDGTVPTATFLDTVEE